MKKTYVPKFLCHTKEYKNTQGTAHQLLQVLATTTETFSCTHT